MKETIIKDKEHGKFSTFSEVLVKSIALGLACMGVATGAAALDRDPLPPGLYARETCQQHITAQPRMTMDDIPSGARGRELNAYVVVAYRLDGSGRAVDAKVVESKPKGLFDKSTLSLLGRTEFAAGVVEASCTYVRGYSTVRQRSR